MKKSGIKNILVPIDFSKMSIQGIETAKRLGRHFGAAIHIAHICEPPYGGGFVGPAMAWRELPMSLADETRKQLAQKLKALASRCGLSPGDKTHFREGAPVFDMICSLADEISADLLVVPTRASKGIKRLFLGSTAERLVQHCPCPVLVDRKSAAELPLDMLPAGPALRIDRILVPVDFSSCSLDALRYAIQFAQKFAAKITLLHVLDLGYSRPMDVTATYDLTRFARAALKDARDQMRKFVRLVKFGSVRSDTAFVIGAPVEQISDFALAKDFDLIITSTHGFTGFKHVLIGSIAEHLVRQSRVPILVVPSYPEVRAANLTGAREWHPQWRQKAESDRNGRQGAVQAEVLTKRSRKLSAHRSPERRKTNKLRESHSR
jgi:nucleotide-binding universal stress UspA family protein